MDNSFLGRKWHIRPRIFVMLLLLLIVIFISVFVACNLFINNYIRTNVQMQLDNLVKNNGMHDDKPRDKPPDSIYMPDISEQPKNKIGFRGEVIILDSDYEIKRYNELGINEDLDELEQIAAFLKTKNISLKNARYEYVRTAEGAYYISTVEDVKQPGSFLVFYVSVTAINHLVGTINLAMAVIMAVAMIICFLMTNVIAGSITKPVKSISRFAEEIGRGNFKRSELSFQDIEFDELGEAMNRSAEKLDEYDKDQRAFFQNVSHELRTPLQSIRCYAEGVKFNIMDTDKSVTTIISETDRLSELVEDLLYISRMDSITSHIEMQEGDLRDTLSLCAESLRHLAERNGLKFEYKFDDEPVLLFYNEKHMFRAFSNLISNALRYARDTITLSCGNTNHGIEVSVTDDGTGISGEDLPHIFERFYKGRKGKHGIGLSIVKSVIELHGGEITVDCSKNTRFTIIFPKKNSHS